MDLNELLPTDSDIEHYNEHGWYVSKKIFTDDEIDAVTDATINRFYDGQFDELPRDAFKDYKIPLCTGLPLRKSDYASFYCKPLFDLVRKPILGMIAERLCGSQPRLWHDQLLWKEPASKDQPANVGWHTDRGYWKTCASKNMLTAWIPFHECGESNGTITMIDGSHKWPDNTENLDFFSNDLAGLEKKFDTGNNEIKKIPIDLPKGHVSFHHCLTIHGSGPNNGTEPRRSIAVHIQDAANHWQEYHHENGTLAQHDNDGFCRKTNEGTPDYCDPEVCPELVN